jgi:hypothetical protein
MDINFVIIIDYVIYFIIFVKVIFLIAELGHIYLFYFGDNESKKNYSSKFLYLKKRSEFVFIILIAILLILSFNPWNKKPISKEQAQLFFLFGIFLFLTAQWNSFLLESYWYPYFKQLAFENLYKQQAKIDSASSN